MANSKLQCPEIKLKPGKQEKIILNKRGEFHIFCGMRRLVFILSALLLGFRYPERPVGYVSDFAKVIPEEYRIKIEALLTELKEKTGAEVAVVTVDTSWGEDYVMYGVQLFEKWGIGERGKDNGILVINFIKDRYIRIEVGYGLEGIIPDGLAGEIRDRYYLPYLRKGDYGRAHWYGACAIAKIIASAHNVTLNSAADIGVQRARSTRRETLSRLNVFFIVLVLLIIVLFKPRGMIYRGRGGIFWGGFGGPSSGSFGGGFGGFGGGSSGGGGAGGHY